MLAIYKKELKSYFHSMIGYVFMAFLLVVIGIYYFATNLMQQVANFEYVLHSVTFIFIVLVPILTMRLISEEKKQKTDQLLFTSPVSVYKIVLAKYLSVLTLFAITMLVVCIYPLVLTQWGKVPLGNAFSSIFGFFLVGAAYISIGLFVSALTESQVIAAVISFLVMLLSYIITSLTSILPTDKLSCMIILICLFTAFSYVVYLSMKSVVAGVCTWFVGTAAFIALYFLKPEFYDGILVKVFSSVALTDRYADFNYGVISFANIFYYVSVVAVFVVLTSLFVKESLSDKLKKGSLFRTSLMVVVVVLCVVANLFVKQLDFSADISKNGLYTVSKRSVQLVESVKDKVTLYYMVAEGKEDPSVDKIIAKYDKLNSNVNVVKKDPILYPQFTKKYTKDNLYQNSVIVVNETQDRFKVVPYDDMFQFDYNASGQYDLTGVDVEGQITSAIQYVTNKELAKMYVVSGHGELELDAAVTKALEKQNITVETLSTITVSKIPDDCKILVMNGPTADISDDELTMIKVYLKNGGKAIFTVSYTTDEMPNFDALLKYYNIYITKGIAAESQGHYAGTYATNILPTVESTEMTQSVLESNKYIFLPICKGLKAKEEPRNTLEVNSLLTSSSDAYSKVNLESNTLEKESGDIEGPFSFALYANEKVDAKETQLVVIGSSNLLDGKVISTSQFANLEFFTGIVGKMVGAGSSISIPVKSTTADYLTIPATQGRIWGAILVIVLPITILVAGLCIWLKRRRA